MLTSTALAKFQVEEASDCDLRLDEVLYCNVVPLLHDLSHVGDYDDKTSRVVVRTLLGSLYVADVGA